MGKIIKKVGRDTVTGLPVDVDITVADTSNGGEAELITIDGLAKNVVRVSSGSYNSTTILGFRILVVGTGTLTFTPIASGAAPVVITSAELIAMGINALQDWPIACSIITLGNSDMELLVYVS